MFQKMRTYGRYKEKSILYSREIKCFECEEKGHYAQACPDFSQESQFTVIVVDNVKH